MITSLPWSPARGRARARRVTRVRAAACAARSADPDGDVLDLARSGDVAAALRRAMERHGAGVFRYCRAALHDSALADDVHQQIFIQVFRDLPRFRGDSPVRAWLFAIAHHRVLDAVKARRRAQARVEAGEPPDAPDPRPSPDELLDELRLRDALIASLAELDERSRSALLLRYQQGFTLDEMAAVCREKAHTLGARVTRALPVLRARIEARIGPVASRAGSRAAPRAAPRARPHRR